MSSLLLTSTHWANRNQRQVQEPLSSAGIFRVSEGPLSQTFSYLNSTDLARCAAVSRTFQSFAIRARSVVAGPDEFSDAPSSALSRFFRYQHEEIACEQLTRCLPRGFLDIFSLRRCAMAPTVDLTTQDKVRALLSRPWTPGDVAHPSNWVPPRPDDCGNVPIKILDYTDMCSSPIVIGTDWLGRRFLSVLFVDTRYHGQPRSREDRRPQMCACVYTFHRPGNEPAREAARGDSSTYFNVACSSQGGVFQADVLGLSPWHFERRDSQEGEVAVVRNMAAGNHLTTIIPLSPAVGVQHERFLSTNMRDQIGLALQYTRHPALQPSTKHPTWIVASYLGNTDNDMLTALENSQCVLFPRVSTTPHEIILRYLGDFSREETRAYQHLAVRNYRNFHEFPQMVTQPQPFIDAIGGLAHFSPLPPVIAERDDFAKLLTTSESAIVKVQAGEKNARNGLLRATSKTCQIMIRFQERGTGRIGGLRFSSNSINPKEYVYITLLSESEGLTTIPALEELCNSWSIWDSYREPGKLLNSLGLSEQERFAIYNSRRFATIRSMILGTHPTVFVPQS